MKTIKRYLKELNEVSGKDFSVPGNSAVRYSITLDGRHTGTLMTEDECIRALQVLIGYFKITA